ncbi:sensor histidine kinase [Shewanella violacea]|uniref:histidine kinase n=1 Tax=Shewanella violacea (strain JCM 10179 / CIP 106290 / LMG 19151 / DSS12) TaxID=637905 RepID=D4ZKQ1_SHEVD|nr:ATP-binding protein [Shewanella violacea]BAJ02250.1 sensor histidine kinase [Shewanella violacea DSS12]
MKLITKRISFENKLFILTLLTGLLPCSILFGILYSSDLAIYAKISLVSFSLVLVYLAFLVRKIVVYQLGTLTNVLEALTCEDYSMRARVPACNGVLSEFSHLLNNLAETLAQQSLITKEKHILLHKVITQIDVAIIATDNRNNITLMNPAAEKLFSCHFNKMQGWPLKALGLPLPPPGQYRQVVEFDLREHKKKVYLHCDEYFENGVKQQLLFITDIQNLLREEERQAWQKLLRVLSHEINNSLAPIASISDTLSRIMVNKHHAQWPELESDFKEGLAVIKDRADSLNNFIQSYQQLTKLPPPDKTLFDLVPLIASITSLFEGVDIRVKAQALEVYTDEIQLKQVLVNLIKNAHESMKDNPQGSIIICCQQQDNLVEIQVIDEGSGISNMDNVFVPFYTTKEKGTGIGLVLSRQLIMNNGGDLDIRNNANGIGVQASIFLPAMDS